MKWLVSILFTCLCLLAVADGGVRADPFIVLGEEDSTQQKQDWEVKQLFQEARCLHKQGYIERALNLYKKAYDLDPGRIDVLPYLGLAFAQLGDYEQAISAFDTYLVSENDEYLVSLNRSVCLINLGRWLEALQAIEACPEQYWQDDFRYYLLKGVCLECLGRADESLPCLEKAYELKSDNVEVVLWYALILRSLDRLSEREEILHKALLLEDRGILKDNLANVLFAEGEFTKSVDYFSQAYDLGIKRSKLNEAIVEINFLHERDLLLKTAEINDNFLDNPLSDYLYALCLYRQGYYADSERVFCQILEKLPNYKVTSVLNDREGNLNDNDLQLLKVSAQRYLALSLFKNKKYSQATELFANNRELNSSDPWAHYNYSLSLYHSDKKEEALQEAKIACELVSSEAKNYEPIYYHLALMYEKNNQFRYAVHAYKHWLQAYPDNKKVPLVKRHLKSLSI